MSEGGLGSFLPPLVVQVLGDTKELSASMREATGEVEGFSKRGGGSFAKLASVGKAALFGIGTAAIGVGVEAVHLADKWETAHASMQTAIKNTGSGMGRWQTQISATDKRMESLGFTNADTESGMASLVTATGSVKKSLADMSVVADVARVKNISLSAAGVLVAKASEGQSRAIKTLGINLNVAAGGARQLVTAHRSLVTAQKNYTDTVKTANAAGGKTLANEIALQKSKRALTLAQKNYNDVAKSGTIITNALSQKLGGQASAYAQTFTGKMAVLKAQTEDLGKNIGVALVPRLEQLETWTEKVVTWFEKHTTTAKALAAVIGGVLAVTIAAYVVDLVGAAAKSVIAFVKMIAAGVTWAAENGAAIATAGAQWAGYAVTVVAEAASGVIASLASMAVAAAAWAAETVVDLAIASAPFLPFIAAVAAIGIAAYEIYKHWNQIWGFIKKITSDAVDFITSHLTLILTVALGPLGLGIAELVEHWSAVWGTIKTVTSDAVNFVKQHLLTIIAVALGPIGVAALLLYKNWGSVWSGIQTVVSDAWSAISPIFNDIISAADKVASAVSKVTSVTGKVTSIISKFAGGTQDAPGGVALVGEQGPELVHLPKHSKVTPAQETARKLAAAERRKKKQHDQATHRLAELNSYLQTPAGRRRNKRARHQAAVQARQSRLGSDLDGQSTGLLNALTASADEGNRKAHRKAQGLARQFAASYEVGTGKHRHHLSDKQQAAALKYLDKQASAKHRADVLAARQTKESPLVTAFGKRQSTLATLLGTQATAAGAGTLSTTAALSSVARARAQKRQAEQLARATKGLASHQAAVAALTKATTDLKTAQKDNTKAALTAARAREYKTGQIPVTAANQGSFLAQTVASHVAVALAAQPPTIVQIDGKPVFAAVQKQSLRKNRRNPTNLLSTS